MTDVAARGGRVFEYRAVARDGDAVRGRTEAVDERAALRKLHAEGLTVTRLVEAAPPRVARGRNRPLTAGERLMILRQLALMLEAGVGLLESMETVAAGLESVRGREQFRRAIDALRRGSALGDVLEESVPGYPFYVYAMVRVGEASGRVSDVLKDAAEQMAYEDRLRRDFANAMTYPAFLAFAGVGAVLFIFTQVVPRFSSMIGEDTSRLPALSKAVLGAGAFVNANFGVIAVFLGLLIAAGLAAAADPRFRARATEPVRRAPVLGAVLRAREIASWARLTSFALKNGVPLLQAAALSRAATPDGPLKRGLQTFEADLKSGLMIDQSLAANTDLTAMDLSLLRAGQRSGTLPVMFGYLADNYENRLRDTMKRLTSLLEPIAIGFIAVVVGVVALSLVLALSSVYETVS